MVAPTNVRFSERVNDALTRYVHLTGQTKSGVINSAVEEWLRMQEHPKIRYATVETGERRARLVDGPEVWSIAEAWSAHAPGERKPEVLSYALGLVDDDVEAALRYWADYRDEIDALIERHRAAQDDALAAWERRQAIDAA